MAFKIVLIAAVIFQIWAAVLALRLNWRYKWHNAWLIISAGCTIMAIQRVAALATIWNAQLDVLPNIPLWGSALSLLIVSILFTAGVVLIEALFRDVAEAEKVLNREKQVLEKVVHDNEEHMRLASDIQRHLLPSESPDFPGFEIAGGSFPAEWTSGDYYDYILADDGALFIVIADVAGHGVGPALLMSETRMLLRALCGSKSDVEEILTIANRTLHRDVTRGRFVTLFLLRIEPESDAASSKKIAYCSAGHAAHISLPSGESEKLTAQGPPLGVAEGFEFAASSPITLDPGAILLLATDGIFETLDPNREQFGDARTLAALHEHRADSAGDIVSELFSASRGHAQGAPQTDDTTIVVVKAP